MSQTAELTKALVERKILGEGTTISAMIPVRIFGDTHVIKEKRGVVTEINSDHILVSYEHGVKKRTDFSEIKTIEDMDVARFAQAYKVKPSKK